MCSVAYEVKIQTIASYDVGFSLFYIIDDPQVQISPKFL